ncbi:MAG TPA: DNA double-strand break repair nuclease NurA [Bacilli bacterium]|nr:DNA double-strand break repair nuclease NurA [Bacilli bacterium]
MNGMLTLAEQLRGLNQMLSSRRREQEHRNAIRAALETNVGEFLLARKLQESDTANLFQGRALVGVDGSVNQFGGTYPYSIHLFKSLAKSTVPSRKTGERAVEKVSLLSPLRADDVKEVRRILEERRQEIRVAPQDEVELERELAEQQAFHLLCDQQMVEMELVAAIEALEAFDPFLMLMDGGFSRLKGKGGELWEQFVEKALDRDTIIVGVIEEVGSYRLRSRIDDEDLLDRFVRGHDREILFGTLEPGEWLKTSLDKPIKNDFYTVFTRLSDLPQAGACDFLREQAGVVEDILDFLYTITPSKSRGIPLWLDIVDAEARLTKKQIDLIVNTNLDQANIESFLRPQRERRDF